MVEYDVSTPTNHLFVFAGEGTDREEGLLTHSGRTPGSLPPPTHTADTGVTHTGVQGEHGGGVSLGGGQVEGEAGGEVAALTGEGDGFSPGTGQHVLVGGGRTRLAHSALFTWQAPKTSLIDNLEF